MDNLPMKNTTYHLGKTFGPVGSFAGVVILVFGLYSLFAGYWGGAVLIVIGAFIGFTLPYTSINYDEKEVRNGDKIFGFLKTGRWIRVEDGMKVGVLNSKRVYRTYSRSNRSLDIPEQQMLICLFDAQGKKLMKLMIARNTEDVEKEINELASKLELEKL